MDFNYEFNHILFPTDFSETANVAMKHAATLASRFKARLTLMNVRESFAESIVLKEYGVKTKEDKEYFAHVNKILEDIAHKLRKDYGIEVFCICESGNIAKEIADFVKANNVSDVVVGMHGIKGRDNYFMGGNAYKIVSSTQVPVLQIDINVATPEYKTIVMPIDSSFHTREKIPYATKLAKAYGAEIKIAGLITSKNADIRSQFTKILHQTELFIEKAGVRYSSETLESDNLAKDTMAYADKVKADLIVIMSEQETSISGIFLGPYAQQIVQNAKIPILTVPPKVNMLMSNVSI